MTTSNEKFLLQRETVAEALTKLGICDESVFSLSKKTTIIFAEVRVWTFSFCIPYIFLWIFMIFWSMRIWPNSPPNFDDFLNFVKRPYMILLKIFPLGFLSQTWQKLDPLHVHRRYARSRRFKWELSYIELPWLDGYNLYQNYFECFDCTCVTFSENDDHPPLKNFKSKNISCRYSQNLLQTWLVCKTDVKFNHAIVFSFITCEFWSEAWYWSLKIAFIFLKFFQTVCQSFRAYTRITQKRSQNPCKHLICGRLEK